MKIAVSCGDINGIGLEAFIKSLYKIEEKQLLINKIEFTLFINENSLLEYFKKINYDNSFLKKISIEKCLNYAEINFGEIQKDAGELAKESVEKSLTQVILGQYDALLTLPISKKSVYLAGWDFPGHTEFIADKCNVNDPLMVLFAENLRVALATVHIPISKVANSLNTEQIIKYTNNFNNSLKKDFAIANPLIAILGLNPHSGENGAMGMEEQDIILPALEKMKTQGINAEGAFPADGFFAHPDYTKYDGIVAMYHDQGLIPLKLLAQGGGVNYTANLPIIRTSPDHGTAFQIAGQDKANPQSTIDAIVWAEKIYLNRKIVF